MNKYVIAGISAFSIWGFFPIPLKALSNYPSGQILFYRLFFALVFLFLITFLFRKGALIATIRQLQEDAKKWKWIGLNIAGGVLLASNWLFFIYSMNQISVQVATFAYWICPILTTLLGRILLKEELNLFKKIAIGLCILSCIILGGASLNNLAFSLITALTYAFYLISQRLLRQFDKLSLMAFQFLVAFVLLLPFYSILTQNSLEVSSHFLSIIGVIAVFFTVLPLFLNTYALKELSSGTVGIFMYINPIISFLLAFFFFKEPATFWEIVAYFCIGVSVIIYNLPKKWLVRA